MPATERASLFCAKKHLGLPIAVVFFYIYAR